MAESASLAAPGQHGKVAILRELETDEIPRILTWLESLDGKSSAEIPGVAVFRAGDLKGTMSEDSLLCDLVSKPRLFATHFSGTMGKGSACVSISDQAAQALLESEAKQIPRDRPGVIILDISSVIGGCREWAPLIRRRLQPAINNRISGVVLYEIALGPDGPDIGGEFIVNDHATNPLIPSETNMLRGFVAIEKSGTADGPLEP